jgi:hypothetical protein
MGSKGVKSSYSCRTCAEAGYEDIYLCFGVCMQRYHTEADAEVPEGGGGAIGGIASGEDSSSEAAAETSVDSAGVPADVRCGAHWAQHNPRVYKKCVWCRESGAGDDCKRSRFSCRTCAEAGFAGVFLCAGERDCFRQFHTSVTEI